MPVFMRLFSALAFVASVTVGMAGPAVAQVGQGTNGDKIDQEQIRRDPTGTEMIADALIARPLGLVGTAVGAVVWVVALPVTLPSNSSVRAAKQMIAKPLQFTFRRPLGQFSSCEALPESC